VTRLASVKDKLAGAECQVLIVSFSPEDGVKRWKQDSKCPFPVYTDSALNLYSYFGMGRSLSKIYCRETIYWFIAEVMSGKKKKPQNFPGINDDKFQSAGDVLFNMNGDVIYSFISKDAIERPEMEVVLGKIKDCNH